MSDQVEPVASNDAATKRTRARFAILGMIFVTVVVNYMDRTNIAVAAPAIKEDWGLSTIQMGYIFSAWGIAYAACQIPGGIFVDRFAARVFYPFLLISWSIATVIHAFVGSVAGLVGCRIAVGVLEAPSYPTNNKVVTSWFPKEERASAIALYTSGQFVGLAFLIPVLTVIQSYVGWKGLFIVTGLIGIVWGIVWYLFYREPEDHFMVNDAELDHIQKDLNSSPATTVHPEKAKFNIAAFFKTLLPAVSHKELWGIYIGQFCLGSTFIFFLTWFPTYLVEYRGLDFIKSGYIASIPFLAGFIGILLSGFTSDYLVRKGVSAEWARKSPVILGMLLSTSLMGAAYTDNNTLIVIFLSIAFFGNGLASIAWVFVSLLAPKNILGLVGGVFNFCGGLSAIVIPIAIGIIVKDGGFEPALILIGSLALLGAISYIFLVGKVETIQTSKN